MSSDGSVLVLTTREKAWWWSMEEVLPTIERVWTGIGRSGRENVRTFCVPLAPDAERSLHSSASQVKRIVLTVPTPGTIPLAVRLRRQLGVDVPMIIYLYGDGTEGLHAFGDFADVLTERDRFVVSSEADAAATRRCLPNAQVEVIPFPLVDQFKLNGSERGTRHDVARLAYVGRVSEQKNLHTLLFALWMLRLRPDPAPEFALDVYGSQDNLGSPNMGLKFPDYGAYLQDLAERLGLADVVTWHGFKPRDWLFDNVHLEPGIFVSPSLHSDENFGTCVLASLVNGHQVVTTAWGGHLGFQEWFPEQLTLVPVGRSTIGPVVDPVLLANAIRAAMDRTSTTVVDDAALDRARAAFSASAVTVRTLELLGRSRGAPMPLQKSSTQRHIDQQRVLFGGTRKIYRNYADPAAQPFFEAYGMKEPLTYRQRSSYILPPWTSVADGVLDVDDPHRGQQRHRIDRDRSRLVDVMTCTATEPCRLPENLVKMLVAQGYAFALPARIASVPRTSSPSAGTGTPTSSSSSEPLSPQPESPAAPP